MFNFFPKRNSQKIVANNEKGKENTLKETDMAMLTTVLNVPMASDSDALAVRSKVDSLRGIFDITVDRPASKVTVDHDPNVSTSAQLRDALRLAGYNASVLSPTGLGAGDVKVGVAGGKSCCEGHGHSHDHAHDAGCSHGATNAKKGDECCGHDHSHSHSHGGWGCNVL